MKVLQVNTDDSRGGAARAALRLHSGLLAHGVESRFLVKQRTGRAKHVPHIYVAEHQPSRYGELIQKYFVNRNTSEAAQAPFSLAFPGARLEDDPEVQAADLIHLHWVCNLLGPRDIGRLQRTGKPLVWTLHDQWAMTGGCHYSGDCAQFMDFCRACPQLKNDEFGLVEAAFRDRLESFMPGLTVVTPSEWMARRTRRSRLFAETRIEVIANCIDEDVFRPKDKQSIRAALGLPADAVVILFACSAAFEKRKGATLFTRLANEIANAPELRRFRKAHPVWAMYIGWHTKEHASALPEKHLGFINDDDALADAFNAADFVINLSGEDNLPNMVIEAMSCGTPVLALRTGGLPEIIDNLISGVLVPQDDFAALRQATIQLITDVKGRAGLSEMARITVEKRFSKRLTPQRYAALYRELIANRSADAQIGKSGSAGRADAGMGAPLSPPLLESKIAALLPHALLGAEQALQEQRAAHQLELELTRKKLARTQERLNLLRGKVQGRAARQLRLAWRATTQYFRRAAPASKAAAPAAHHLPAPPATLVHITHWKAGSQWFRAVLEDAFPGAVVKPGSAVRHFYAEPLKPNKVYCCGYLTRQEFQFLTVPPEHRRVLIIRDLRDTLVSGYFSVRYSHTLMGRLEKHRWLLNRYNEEDGLLYLMDNWLPDSAQIQQSWLEAGEPFFRFEEFALNPQAALARAFFEFFKIDAPQSAIEELVERHSFAKHSGGRTRGEEDPLSHYRKGVPGEWRERFTPRVHEVFNRRYLPLIRLAGYPEQ